MSFRVLEKVFLESAAAMFDNRKLAFFPGSARPRGENEKTDNSPSVFLTKTTTAGHIRAVRGPQAPLPLVQAIRATR